MARWSRWSAVLRCWRSARRQVWVPCLPCPPGVCVAAVGGLMLLRRSIGPVSRYRKCTGVEAIVGHLASCGLGAVASGCLSMVLCGGLSRARL